jgi:hypothetical protein
VDQVLFVQRTKNLATASIANRARRFSGELFRNPFNFFCFRRHFGWTGTIAATYIRREPRQGWNEWLSRSALDAT